MIDQLLLSQLSVHLLFHMPSQKQLPVLQNAQSHRPTLPFLLSKVFTRVFQIQMSFTHTNIPHSYAQFESMLA